MLKSNSFGHTPIFEPGKIFKNSTFNLNTENSAEPFDKHFKVNSTQSATKKSALRLISDEENESLKSLEKEIGKSKYQKQYIQGTTVLAVTNGGNLMMYIPQNTIPGQTAPIFEFDKLETIGLERVLLSITSEGGIRISKAKYAAKNIVDTIPTASLNFDNGIGLKQVRIKLRNGKLVPMMSLVRK